MCDNYGRIDLNIMMPIASMDFSQFFLMSMNADLLRRTFQILQIQILQLKVPFYSMKDVQAPADVRS